MSASDEGIASRLLKLAERRAEDLGGRIDALERALSETVAAIAVLDEAVEMERAAALEGAASGIADFARYSAFTAARRGAIAATAARLEAEIADARAAIEDAFAEMKKFEHVAALAREQAARNRRRFDLAALDEAARRRFARHS